MPPKKEKKPKKARKQRTNKTTVKSNYQKVKVIVNTGEMHSKKAEATPSYYNPGLINHTTLYVPPTPQTSFQAPISTVSNPIQSTPIRVRTNIPSPVVFTNPPPPTPLQTIPVRRRPPPLIIPSTPQSTPLHNIPIPPPIPRPRRHINHTAFSEVYHKPFTPGENQSLIDNTIQSRIPVQAALKRLPQGQYKRAGPKPTIVNKTPFK